MILSNRISEIKNDRIQNLSFSVHKRLYKIFLNSVTQLIKKIN